jgi:DNA invertase Pin-like site-specific DNA recombinase
MTEPIYNQRIRPFTARSRAADKPTGTRCWGYIRVSTDKQVDGTSLESQELGIRAEAMKYRDHTFAEMVRDVTPGGKTRFCDRQGGRQLLGKMVPGDVLIISKVDRFSRSVVDGLNEMREIWRKGITIVCLDMGGEPVSFGDNGEILLFMLLLGAQMENKRRTISCARLHWPWAWRFPSMPSAI